VWGVDRKRRLIFWIMDLSVCVREIFVVLICCFIECCCVYDIFDECHGVYMCVDLVPP